MNQQPPEEQPIVVERASSVNTLAVPSICYSPAAAFHATGYSHG
jgi:hypothetical protein